MEVSSISDIGLVRSQNQDSVLVYQDPPFGLFVVADGMGGYTHGERASGEIVSQLREWAVSGDLPRDSIHTLLDAACVRLSEINRFIWNAWNRNTVCGSTCVMLLTLRDCCGIVSVGDSRIYRCRGFQCGPMTRDDVWENQESVRAAYTEEEIARHPNYGKLLCAVGGAENLQCASSTERLFKGDVFALCSDGVYKMCSPKFLQKQLRAARKRELDEVRSQILREVYRNGAQDNASLILVRCMEGE